jgi:hypothetical protein
MANGTHLTGPLTVVAGPGASAFADVVTLTDNSGGTASATIAAIGATYDQDEVRNAIASLAAAINALAERVQ